jgi:hypothetical protein
MLTWAGWCLPLLPMRAMKAQRQKADEVWSHRGVAVLEPAKGPPFKKANDPGSPDRLPPHTGHSLGRVSKPERDAPRWTGQFTPRRFDGGVTRLGHFAGFFGDLRAASSVAAFAACFSARDLCGLAGLVPLASCVSFLTFCLSLAWA